MCLKSEKNQSVNYLDQVNISMFISFGIQFEQRKYLGVTKQFDERITVAVLAACGKPTP